MSNPSWTPAELDASRRLNKSTRRALINGRAPQSAIQQTFIAAAQRSQNAPLVQPLAQQPVAAISATTSHQASVAHPPSLNQNTAFVQPPAQQPVAATSATTSHQASVAHPPSLSQDTAFVQQPAEQHVATISQQTSASPDYIIPDYIDTILSPMHFPEAERDFDTWTDDGMWDIQIAPPEQEKHGTSPKDDDCPGSKGTPSNATPPRHSSDDCPGSKGTPSNATTPRHSSDDGTSPHTGSPHLPFEDHRPSGFEATSPKATPPLHPSDDDMLHIGSPHLPLDPPEDEKRQGPPERWVTSTGPFAFSEAFDLMFHTLHNTLNLRTIPIIGVTLEEKDLLSIPWPRWYTDAVMDIVGRRGVRGAPFPDTIYYQDAVAIIAHVAVLPITNVYGRHVNRQKLEDWCTSLRHSEIQKPGNRWPCGRMKSTCLSVVFGWTPFNSHWIAVQITKGGTITIWDSLQSAVIKRYAQMILPVYARLIALNPANQWEESAFDDCQVEYAATLQQNNNEDCGPAAATTIYHLLRVEPNEQVFDGRYLRFTHLVMVYNASNLLTSRSTSRLPRSHMELSTSVRTRANAIPRRTKIRPHSSTLPVRKML